MDPATYSVKTGIPRALPGRAGVAIVVVPGPCVTTGGRTMQVERVETGVEIEKRMSMGVSRR